MDTTISTSDLPASVSPEYLERNELQPTFSAVERRRLQNRINKRNSRIRQTGSRPKKSEIWTIYMSPKSETDAVVHLSSSFCQLQVTERNRYVCMLRDITLGGARAHILQPERLLCVSQYNLILAMASNAAALAISMEDLRHDIQSPFNTGCSPFRRELPPALQPTAAQRDINHHPWIDLCPSPAFRDILLNRSAEYDDGELCKAMFGGLHQRPGVLVWGDAWDPAAYELTEHFLQRYGWLFWDCADFVRSTNNWRRRRGERVLSLPDAKVGEISHRNNDRARPIFQVGC